LDDTNNQLRIDYVVSGCSARVVRSRWKKAEVEHDKHQGDAHFQIATKKAAHSYAASMLHEQNVEILKNCTSPRFW